MLLQQTLLMSDIALCLCIGSRVTYTFLCSGGICGITGEGRSFGGDCEKLSPLYTLRCKFGGRNSMTWGEIPLLSGLYAT